MKKTIISAFFIIFFSYFSAFGQNEIVTISTYYPSPVGVYRNLRLFPIAAEPASACDSAGEEGTMYYDNGTNQVQICRQTGTAPDTFAWFPIGGLWTLAGVAPNQFIYPNDTNWNVLIGTNTALATNGRMQIAHPAVPLIFSESDFTGNAGMRWRMPLDAGILRFDATNAAGAFTELGVLSMDPTAPNGRVGVGVIFPQADLEINNTLRLVPVASSGYNIEGGIYYDSDEHRLKYRDNTAWKNLGSSMGATQEVTKKLIPNNSVDIMCSPNYAVTRVKVYTYKNCTRGCTVPEITKMGVVCSQLQ